MARDTKKVLKTIAQYMVERIFSAPALLVPGKFTLLHSGHCRGEPMFNEEREFCIDNLLVRIHSIIDMILVDQSCAMGV